jgi:hypothetical protein
MGAVMAGGGGHWARAHSGPRFGTWVAQQPWFERLAKRPGSLPTVLPQFADHLAETVRGELSACGHNDILALTGIASLFGLTCRIPIFPGHDRTFTNIPSGRKASSLASFSQVEHLDGIHGPVGLRKGAGSILDGLRCQLDGAMLQARTAADGALC